MAIGLPSGVCIEIMGSSGSVGPDGSRSIRISYTWIHLYLIYTTKWVHQWFAGFHFPAAIKHLIWLIAHSPSRIRAGNKIIIRP